MKNALPITRKQNFSNWYQEVIKGADLAEMSGVRGCMIIKPWGYGIWERIQRILDDGIKDKDYQNCYFPFFIPLNLFEKEAQHVDGFAKEMALTTHTRVVQGEAGFELEGKLEIPLVARPTSETMIGESFSKWISSYRDLPMKINQWANIVRWEMRPRLFLRTSEFIWQEIHAAFANEMEARTETNNIIDLYESFATDVLRIPVIKGKKTESEKFPGAVDTYTIEAMMQDGKALQAGTSHYLGQGFAKSADISFQDSDGEVKHTHTISCGVSTRLIGGLIMVHSDDDGLKLPPQIAPQQIVILPIVNKESESILAYCNELKSNLTNQCYKHERLRVKIQDTKIKKPGVKWDWIRKGVPILVEVGSRECENEAVCITVRDNIHEKKMIMAKADFLNNVESILEKFDQALYDNAEQLMLSKLVHSVTNFEELEKYFKKDQTGFVFGKWCGSAESEEKLSQFGVTIRCLPNEQSGTEGTCIISGDKAHLDAVFAKSY